MKKATMIEKILNKEKELFATLNLYEDSFGMNDEVTCMARREWSTIYQLCEELGIK